MRVYKRRRTSNRLTEVDYGTATIEVNRLEAILTLDDFVVKLDILELNNLIQQHKLLAETPD